MMSVGLRNVGVDRHRTLVGMPCAFDDSVAHNRTIVAESDHRQVRCVGDRSRCQQVAAINYPGGITAESDVIDIQCLENEVEIDVAQLDFHHIGRIGRSRSADRQQLIGMAYTESVDIDALSVDADARWSDVPDTVVEDDFPGIDIDRRQEPAVVGAVKTGREPERAVGHTALAQPTQLGILTRVNAVGRYRQPNLPSFCGDK